MRIPTFSRHSDSDTADADRPAATTPVRPRTDADDTTVTNLKPASAPARAPQASDRDLPPAQRPADRHTPPPPPPVTTKPPVAAKRDSDPVETVVPAGPKPRASLLATLGLILGVAAVLLVLSGPLLGYGIGVGGLALVLSLAGIRATGKRHVAGKTDALIGMVLSLGAIVLGVLALTGSLSWLGTDVQPVNSLREWLDTQFVDRF